MVVQCEPRLFVIGCWLSAVRTFIGFRSPPEYSSDAKTFTMFAQEISQVLHYIKTCLIIYEYVFSPHESSSCQIKLPSFLVKHQHAHPKLEEKLDRRSFCIWQSAIFIKNVAILSSSSCDATFILSIAARCFPICGEKFQHYCQIDS